jgi:hypothetical protein
MKRVVIVAMLLGGAACGWDRTNPLDPSRCSPSCKSGQQCVEGRCVASRVLIKHCFRARARARARARHFSSDSGSLPGVTGSE